jgi:hypothetical protein
MCDCLHHKNLSCGFRNPMILAIVLLLVATLAFLSAFDLEGARAVSVIDAQDPSGGGSRENRDSHVQSSGQGCYHVVRQASGADVKYGAADPTP